MSGGHYEYSFYQLEYLADEIEKDFKSDGRNPGGDAESFYGSDLLNDVTSQRKTIILKEIRTLILDLRNCARRAKELEWFVSGDTTAESYLENLKEHSLLQ